MTMATEDASRRASAAERHSFSHHLSPGILLELAAVVNGATYPAFLISGGVFQTSLGGRLSPEGERCAQQMADLAAEILRSWDTPPVQTLC
jgi:hypothetical protein